MKVLEMRAFLKGRGVRGYSTLKKSKLEEEVQKIQQEDERAEYEQKLRDTALCLACLNEQRIQRKIDKREHNQRLYESLVRALVCEYCQHPNFAYDGDLVICTKCGVLQSDLHDENPSRWRIIR